MTFLAVCGILCDECEQYGRECSGCQAENKGSSYKCRVYECAMERGVALCAECEVKDEDCEYLGYHLDLCPLYVVKSMKFYSIEGKQIGDF